MEAAAALLAFGPGVEGLQALARYSGRAGLPWFTLVFVIEPWNRLAPSELSRFALARRRHLGLAFGYHHFVHLALLLTYLEASGRHLDLSRAAGGMLGYAFLLAMMLTSTDGAVARLGRANWKRLHRTGLWLLWVIFFVTYVTRLQGKVPGAGGGTIEFVLCTTLLLWIAALRVTTFFSTRAIARVG